MPLRHDLKRAMHQLLMETDASEMAHKPLTARLQIAFDNLLRQSQRFRPDRLGIHMPHDWKTRFSSFHRRMSPWRKRQGVVR